MPIRFEQTLRREVAPGPESLEARLFDEADIPWETIAFRTVEQTLSRYFAHRARGVYTMHTSAIRYEPRRKA